MDTRRLDLELDRLDLRFADARLIEPRAVERIARSIECGGQIVPCIAVVDPPTKLGTDDEHLVLIDGYRRVAALRRLGRDTASVECWLCDLAEALLGLLARTQSRPFAPIEEALLVRELTQGLGLPHNEVARRCGRNASWVTRRLQLLSALPDTALEAVRAGWLSSWAATRIIVPLARANSGHADHLVMALSEAPLSTRELRRWFEQYERASRTGRERLVTHPQLFLQAVRETAEQDNSQALRDGLEGECEAHLRQINVLIAAVRKQLPTLRPLPQTLVSAVLWLQASFQALCHDIEREEDDSQRNPQQRANLEGARTEPARDQSATEALA
jgi:ParB family transcriptional regulator, chromosome partitioning protein